MPLMLWQFFPIVSKMVSNISSFQGIVSKLEITVSWQHKSRLAKFWVPSPEKQKTYIHLKQD